MDLEDYNKNNLNVIDTQYFSDKEKYGWDEDTPTRYFVFKHETAYKYSGWYKGYLNSEGVHHRINGPARIWEGGAKEYYLNGIFFPDIKNDEEWIIKQIIE